jgi:tetratricopeptide (TPR) repeat protein
MSEMQEALPDFDALWDFDRPDETEVKFRALLAEPNTEGNQTYRTELLTQIARTEGLQRRFAEAHHTLDKVEALLTAEPTRIQVRYLLERGRIFNSSRQPERALPLFIAAWEAGIAAGEEGFAVDAAHMAAIAAPVEARLAWNHTALELAERSADAGARKWRASLYNNIGWTLHAQGDFVGALECFEQAAAIQQNEGEGERLRIAKWCVARTLRSLGRVEDALAAQQEQLRELESTGREGPYVYEELAECLWHFGRQEEARPYFGRAYKLLAQDPWFVESEPERLERLRELSAIPETER